jgi:diadenylate cyclase
LLQALASASARGLRTLLVSGEESPAQVRMRAQRLAAADGVGILAETDLAVVVETIAAELPDVCVIDSVQTLHAADVGSGAGSVAQVREAADRLLRLAKSRNVAIVLVGHVTKDGTVAGPRVLEHLVDAVLQFEGDRYRHLRVLRAVKNRFGSTDEIGIFEMTGAGLVPVVDPSSALAEDGAAGPGSVLLPAIEGSRPILLEVQALVAPSDLAMPRRQATGFDRNRLSMIAAVLGRHAGIALGSSDVFVNVAGGVRVDEPAADLAVALAIVSSPRGSPRRPSWASPTSSRRPAPRRRAPSWCAALIPWVRRSGWHWPDRMTAMSEPLVDVRTDPKMLEALRRIAPGTNMRQGINDILRGDLGALIVIGEPAELSFLFSGGIRLDQSFSPYLLYELAKMDGAIILNAMATRIVYANVQLMPDPTIPSAETGTRHRTAERVAKQTGALVISISQQRDVVTLYVSDARYQLEEISDVLAKTNQAVTTLETYRTRFDQVSTRLTALEFQGAAMLDDVLVALQRAEMTSRMRSEIERNVVELGVEGRLIKIQLDEMSEWVPGDEVAMVRDYCLDSLTGGPERALEQLHALPDSQLLEVESLAEVLGYPRTISPVDHAVTPRGYRVLSKVPRLPEGVVNHVVAHFGTLEAFVRASQGELEEVEGVGAVRAREIREGLRRLQEQNLVDRYLNL